MGGKGERGQEFLIRAAYYVNRSEKRASNCIIIFTFKNIEKVCDDS